MSENPESAIYQQLARVGKAAASPHRIALLGLLSQAPRTVEKLATAAGLPLRTASQHLQILKAARLVATRRRGTHVEYRLASTEVAEFFLGLRDVAGAHLPELEGARAAHVGRTAAADPDRLLEAIAAAEVTLLDVRPPEEFAAGHLAPAINTPPGEVGTHLQHLPKGRPFVAYCRGPLCAYARDAVRLLRSHGYDAFVLDLGIPDLRRRGYLIEIEAA